MNELPDCTANHAAGPPARVGIVGGGFCGTLVLANLVEAAARPLVIELFEPMMLATGVAYSTTECTHLLNVRAERMGAFADQPDHFYRWLQSAAGKTATVYIYSQARGRIGAGQPNIKLGPRLGIVGNVFCKFCIDAL